MGEARLGLLSLARAAPLRRVQNKPLTPSASPSARPQLATGAALGILGVTGFNGFLFYILVNVTISVSAATAPLTHACAV